MTKLYKRAIDSCRLEHALESWDGGRAPALMYSPSRCILGHWNGEYVVDVRGPVSTDGVFEARVFSNDGELRWLHEGGGLGRAVVLRETAADGFEADEYDDTPIDQWYLLWGRGTDRRPTDGWSRLAASRIGSLDVPLPDLTQGHCVRLHTREYLRCGQDGNMAVAEERFIGLEVYHG